MIENHLKQWELASLLGVFLRIEPLDQIVAELNTLGFPTAHEEPKGPFRAALCCTEEMFHSNYTYDTVHLVFGEYRVWLRMIHHQAPDKTHLEIEFRAKKKWWHGLRDQNSGLIATLQKICCDEMEGLKFKSCQILIPPSFISRDPSEYVTFYHDSRFESPRQKIYIGEIAPLAMCSESNEEYCFVPFVFRSSFYERRGNTTVLRKPSV